MKVKEMGKQKRQRDERLIVEPDQRLNMHAEEAAIAEALKPRRYVPPQCSVCTRLRPEGKDFTEVYRTVRETGYIFRYCKCGFCGNTFKDSEKI